MSLADRMDATYTPPVLTEPVGGPVPDVDHQVQAAGTDLAAQQLQDQWQQAKTDLLAQWPQTAQPMVDELATQAEEAVQQGDVAGLGSLAVSAAVLAALALPLAVSGTALAVLAAAGVVEQAAAQGASITAPDSPGAIRVRQHAHAVAAIIASGYAAGAARAALQLTGADPREVRGAVETVLADLATGTNGLVGGNIGTLLASAQYAGRLAVLEQHPAESYVAVEANDGPNKCRPCAMINGKTYRTLREGLADYPNAGGTYRRCEGRDRCHGHLRPIWN